MSRIPDELVNRFNPKICKAIFRSLLLWNYARWNIGELIFWNTSSEWFISDASAAYAKHPISEQYGEEKLAHADIVNMESWRTCPPVLRKLYRMKSQSIKSSLYVLWERKTIWISSSLCHRISWSFIKFRIGTILQVYCFVNFLEAGARVKQLTSDNRHWLKESVTK